MLEPTLFGLMNGGRVEFVLRHRSRPRSVLGRCWLLFLSAEQLAELQEALCVIKLPPDASDGERSAVALRLMNDIHGAAYAPNVAPLSCH